jgi:HPt (histidine-containing phosphotransfer) domain-containing protein
MPTPASPPPAIGPASSLEAPRLLTLDSAGAIALMDDSVELYQEIAQAYLLEIGDLGPRLGILLQTAPLEEATRTLHTAKGLAATVGAHHLSDVCRQCELQIKSLPHERRVLDAAMYQSMKDALDQSIAATQQALRVVLANLDAQVQQELLQVPPGVDLTALLKDLRALRALLVHSDAKALDLNNTLLARYIPVQEQLHALNRAVRTFDFVQAVVQCDELICNFSSPIIR